MNNDLSYTFIESFLAWIKKLKLKKIKSSFFKFFKPQIITPVSIRYSIKTAISVVISYLIALLISSEFAFWAPISAIIVMQVNVASSVESSMDRITGCLYGAVIGIFLSLCLPRTLLASNFGLFIIANFCALLLLINPRYRLAGITSISIFLIGDREHSVLAFAGMFILLIVVSILVSVCVSVLLWPVSGAEELRDSLKKQYLMCASFLDTITISFMNGQSHLLPTYIDSLHDAISKNRPQFRKVKEYEAINLARHYPELDLLIVGLEQIRVYLSSMLDALDSDSETIEKLPMSEELMELSASSASGIRWIASHSEGQTLPEVRWYIEATSIRISDLWKENTLTNLTPGQITQILSFYNAMNHLAETIANLEEQIEIVTQKNARFKSHPSPFKNLHPQKQILRFIKKFKKTKKK